jgi:hypothetical protein
MPAKTNTPAALGGTQPSPDEPASNRAMKDPAMARIPRLSPQPAATVIPGLDPGIQALPPRHSRAACPGSRPGSGNPEPPSPAVPQPCSPFPAQAGTHSSAPVASELASEMVPLMTLPREIPARELVFVDPGVSDIETLLGRLRPEIEAILLDPVRPAAHQIAAAVAGRHGLDAVHVIAHGAPGRVNFAAGDWSAATLEDEAEDLAAIGQALGAARSLNLWSCQTAAGPAGAAFIAGLARASGADIAAATGLVGAAALGGGWELTAAARPPLTAGGVAGYAGVMATDTFTAANTDDTWVPGNGHSWSTNPTQTPAAGTNLVFLNTSGTSSGQTDPTNYIFMPPTLNQATGTGTSSWTISDTNNSPTQFESTLILDNQGNIFVNGTNNFTAGSAITAWTLTGAAAGVNTGNQYFENDGNLNIIGTTGGGSTTANFTATTLTTAWRFSGQINLHLGNALSVLSVTSCVRRCSR